MRRSINRPYHFNKAYDQANTIDPTIISNGFNSGEFLMSYSVGTPPFKLYGVLDTGSSIIWFQCIPCENCYYQTSPIFDPSKSLTYRNLPCSSSICQSIPSGSYCYRDDKQTCEYVATYDDGSYTRGDLSVDTLTLESTNGYPISFPGFVIGCGHNNIGTYQGQSSGIVGLGNGLLSLRNQLGTLVGSKFSYCLVPIFSDPNISSKLNFGDNAVVSGYGTVSTPLVQRSGKVSYYLTLEAFSVGNNRVEFRSTSFGSSEEGNIIIDSGTTLTRLPNDVYFRVESAVIEVVNHERTEDPFKLSRLCYITTSRQLEVPIITAHFMGADIQLNPLNTFVQVDDDVACFDFLPTQGYPIFGNLAQQNFLIGYDFQNNVISFKPTDCTKY